MNARITTQNETASRAIRATVGVTMIVPAVAAVGLAPWTTFGLALVGSCLVFTAMIGRSNLENLLACAAAITATTLMLATAGVGAVSIAALSIASVGVVLSALLGMQLPMAKVAESAQAEREQLGLHINRASGTVSVYDDHKLAA